MGCRYGGQFAYVEVINSMKKPAQFTSAVALATPIMSGAYLCLGMIGYWSRGRGVQEIIIFGTGMDVWSRVAAGAILFQVDGLPLPLQRASMEQRNTSSCGTCYRNLGDRLEGSQLWRSLGNKSGFIECLSLFDQSARRAMLPVVDGVSANVCCQCWARKEQAARVLRHTCLMSALGAFGRLWRSTWSTSMCGRTMC